MPYQQVRRPVGTASGLHDGSDGGRLLEIYASQAVIPEESTVPVILRGAPGYSDGYDAVPAGSSVKNMIAIDSPVYGNHLFIFTNTHFYVFSGVDANGELTAANLFASHPFPNTYNLDIPDDQLLRWATDGRNIVFITEDEVYGIDREIIQAHINGDTSNDVFLTIAAPTPDDDSDATDTEAWVDVVYADGYFVLASKGGQLFNSGLGTLSFDQLDFSRADVKPDGIVGLAYFQNQLFVYGTQSIERWQNKGLADFAFQRDTSSIFDIGCYSRETIVQNEVAMHFLGSDLSFYALVGNRLQKISNDVVDRLIRKSITNNAGHRFPTFQYSEEGHKFVGLHMDDPDDKYYWVFDWITRQWHERYASDAVYLVECVRWRDSNYVAKAGERKVRNMALRFKENLINADGQRYISLPIIQIDQMRFRHFSMQFDLHYEGDDSDDIDLTLEWSDNNKVTWKGGGAGRTKRWLKGIRTKFNNLGQVGSQGRHYRLRINGASGEIALLGAYIEAEILAD